MFSKNFDLPNMGKSESFLENIFLHTKHMLEVFGSPLAVLYHLLLRMRRAKEEIGRVNELSLPIQKDVTIW